MPSPTLDAVFRALADPTRREMLRSLAEGDRSIGELAAPLRMSFAGASKHVQALERAGLLRRTVKAATMSAAWNRPPWPRPCNGCASMNQFWSGKLDALAAALAAHTPPASPQGEQHE